MATIKPVSFNRLPEIDENDGKVILHDGSQLGRSTKELGEIIDDRLRTGLEDGKQYAMTTSGWKDIATNFYDKRSVDESLNSKQDILTFGYDEYEAISSINNSALAGKTYSAGDNIDITNDVISVTGLSTYTPGQMIQIKNDVIDIKNNNCSAIGDASMTIGSGTIAGSKSMFAMGNYNKTTADVAFVIGNGTYAARSDAFIVYPTGQVSGSDFTTNGVSLSGMLVLYNALTARPLTGSYTLKCIDGVLTWEGEVPSNAISVNNEQVGVNDEGFSVGN